MIAYLIGLNQWCFMSRWNAVLSFYIDQTYNYQTTFIDGCVMNFKKKKYRNNIRHHRGFNADEINGRNMSFFNVSSAWTSVDRSHTFGNGLWWRLLNADEKNESFNSWINLIETFMNVNQMLKEIRRYSKAKFDWSQ